MTIGAQVTAKATNNDDRGGGVADLADGGQGDHDNHNDWYTTDTTG
jgi:hypothetical protein